MSTTATLRNARIEAKAAEKAAADARKLADIIRTYEMLVECEIREKGTRADGFIEAAMIANYVDVAAEDILALADDAMENVTSPTHKVLVWGSRISADLVTS